MPRRGAARWLEEPAEQVLGWEVERLQEPKQGGQAYLTDAAFDPADLDGGQASGVGEVFLGPAALVPGLADVCSELLER